MAEYNILKAIEFDKLAAKVRKQHADVHALQRAGWWLQPKYDGCFGMAVIEPEREMCRMLSRTGEDYTQSCRHILDELHIAGEGYSAIGFVVLGEVWHPKLKFPTISGQFRKRSPSWLQFMCNDLLPAKLVTEQPYAERFSALREMLPLVEENEGYHCHVVQCDFGRIECWAGSAAAELVAQGGYDGAILRDPRASYTLGTAREGQIVKVKPTLSLDLAVTAIFVEPGAKTGRPVYTLEVDYRGVRSMVGSGVPHAPGDEIHEGAIVEVECMGLTEDGKLREPRFKGVRHDKLKADE